MRSGAVLFSDNPQSLQRGSPSRREPMTGADAAHEFDPVSPHLPGPLASKPGRFPAANTAHAKLSLLSFAVPAGAEAAGGQSLRSLLPFYCPPFLAKGQSKQKAP